MAQVAASTPWTATFRSLRHRNYRLYFFGQIVSLTGFWMQMTALRWLTYDLTSASQWVALVAAAQNMPTVFLAGFGGALADRFSRRSLVLITQSGFMVLSLLLSGFVYAEIAMPGLLLAFATASGVVHAIDLPTRLALVKELVDRDDLINAVALNSLQFNVARIIGPWLGGMVLVGLGPWPCFLANALSYCAVLAALGAMEIPVAPAERAAAPSAPALLGGMYYLASHPGLAVLVLLAAAVSFCGWPFMELLPALAKNYLGVAELGYSRLLTGTGIGALTAAMVVATFGSENLRRLFLGLGVACVVAGLGGLAMSRTLYLGMFFSALVGCGLILFLTTAQSTLQLEVSDDQRGRVMGIWAMVWSGAAPVGNLLLGPAADRWGEPLVLLLQGLGLLLAASVLAILWWIWQRRRPARQPSL
jgi:MFS family permease